MLSNLVTADHLPMNAAVAIFFSAMNVVVTNVFAPDGLIVPFVLITSLYSTNINEHYLPSRPLMHEKNKSHL